MVIGIPKEILEGENRVAIIPDVASKLIKSGFQVIIEKDAGLKAGFTNDKYDSFKYVIKHSQSRISTAFFPAQR